MTEPMSCAFQENGEGAFKQWRVQTFRVALAVTIRPDRGVVRTPRDAVDASRAILRGLDADREHFAVLALDVKHRLVGFKVVASGNSTGIAIRPREVLRAALLLNADAILVVHNHPSGDAEPSGDDLRITEVLAQAGRLTGIEVLDHLVLGES